MQSCSYPEQCTSVTACFGAAQITQPTDNTGIAIFSGINCTIANFNILTAGGFGLYDGTSPGTNYYL
jgi:hypothetical protein